MNYYDPKVITYHEKLARELFYKGYNCAQSVFVAFSDLTGYGEEEAARLASSFGGGMCGLRTTCGSVTSMLMVLGALRGYSAPGNHAEKVAHYADGKMLADEFSSLFGTIICRELLVGIKTSPVPSERTEEYYKKRPCVRFCAAASNILDNFLTEKGYDIEKHERSSID